MSGRGRGGGGGSLKVIPPLHHLVSRAVPALLHPSTRLAFPLRFFLKILGDSQYLIKQNQQRRAYTIGDRGGKFLSRTAGIGFL